MNRTRYILRRRKMKEIQEAPKANPTLRGANDDAPKHTNEAPQPRHFKPAA